MQRKRNAPQPLELQRSRTRTMGVGKGPRGPLRCRCRTAHSHHIAQHSAAAEHAQLVESFPAACEHPTAMQQSARARTVQSFSSACAVPSHLPSTPSHAHTERSCTEHAGSEHASPDALRVAQQLSSSAAPDRCRRSRRPRGARIAHTPLEEQIRPAALDSTRSIEPTATSTSRPSLWRPVRLRDLVLVDVALAASGRAMERFKRLQRRAL